MISVPESSYQSHIGENPTQTLTEKIFSPDGWLQEHLQMEHRPQQEAMAGQVAQSFVGSTSLLFEAGTGVGKSLAYLIPGLIHAMLNKRPFIVSSHTIALQEQIKNKDLELCRALFTRAPELHDFADFRVAMLVGRGNYLCGHRLAQAIQTKMELFGSPEIDDLERIAHWSAETQTGLKEELNPPPLSEVWDWVSADSSSCNKRNCTHESCFYRRALLQRTQAHIIIVNHSLLFSFISAGLVPGQKENGILYPNDLVVLDEAHRVPEIATDHFGIGISSFAIERSLKMLYNSGKKKPRGLLVKLRDRAAQATVTRALAESENFFNGIRRQYLAKSSILRLHEENWTAATLNPALANVVNRLKILQQGIDSKSTKEELEDHCRRLQDYIAGLANAIELRDEAQVYWLEKGGRRGQLVHIRSAPLDVSEYLNESVFSRGSPAILTSATIATGESMEAFKKQSGAWDQQWSIEKSPFDYERNMHIAIARDCPAPTPQQGRLDLDYIAQMIEKNALREEGGTLVLFTSYADMTQVAGSVQSAIEDSGRTLLVQGQGYSRSDLKTHFVDAGDAVLFGTDSFWTGFDVPGQALSQVIIPRLPFINPSHPLSEAISEAIRTRGGSPFNELLLPDAVIKFRQGIGRLIRSKSDYGKITILDSRILTKSYGRAFLDALPHSDYQVFTREDI